MCDINWMANIQNYNVRKHSRNLKFLTILQKPLES